MEKLREKRQAMQEQLEELEKKEMLSNKKLAWLTEITAKNQKESETLRRSCSLTEYNLDKKEDLLEQKLQKFKEVSTKRDEEDRMVKILETRDIEMEDEISRFEKKVKQAIRRADESEMKYHEVVRKLALTESDLIKVQTRQHAKEHDVRELEEAMKHAGRQIHRLEINDEKSGEREDKNYRLCRRLSEKESSMIMRAEEAERRVRMLQKSKNAVEEELNVFRKNCTMMQSELEDTLTNLDHV